MAKHMLNFEPTVKYRTGSRFLYQFFLAVLYGIPLLMALQLGYTYCSDEALAAQMTDQHKLIKARFDKTVTALNERRPDPEDLAEPARQAAAVDAALRPLRVSWSLLLDQLEELMPDDVRCIGVRIRPTPTMQILVDGEGRTVAAVTAFLRRLLGHPQFAAPFLANHQSTPEGTIRFTMQAVYLPPTPEVAP